MVEEDSETMVKLAVFLREDERTDFKVACAKEKINMSQQARKLILGWLEEHKSKENG